jgi:hypothetical protein
MLTSSFPSERNEKIPAGRDSDRWAPSQENAEAVADYTVAFSRIQPLKHRSERTMFWYAGRPQAAAFPTSQESRYPKENHGFR